jgi:hypothetical protein
MLVEQPEELLERWWAPVKLVVDLHLQRQSSQVLRPENATRPRARGG